MSCPTCGSENEAEALFCTSCGVPLESIPADPAVYCANCGSENPAEAQFCIRCGVPLGGTPEPPQDRGGAGPVGTRTPKAEVLVPRDLGELVSETFRALGASRWAFFSIALFAQIPTLAITIAWPTLDGGSNPVALALIVFFAVAALVLGIIAGGAMFYAVIRQYLGLSISVTACYAWSAARFWSLLVAGILFPLVVILLFFTVIGIPIAFYLMASWHFYIQIILLEKQGPVQALDSSRRLVRGTWWSIFGIGIVFIILEIIIVIAISIPVGLLSFGNSTVGNIASFIGAIVVMPIGLIATALVYFDLRVRKEGFTLEALAQEVGVKDERF